MQLGKPISLPQTSIVSFLMELLQFLPSHRAVCTDDGSSLVKLFEKIAWNPVGGMVGRLTSRLMEMDIKTTHPLFQSLGAHEQSLSCIYNTAFFSEERN